MVSRTGGYYSEAFWEFWGVTQGYPLPPTIFNVVVYAVARNWLSLVAGGVGGPDGFGGKLLHCAALLCKEGGLVVFTYPEWTRGALWNHAGLFDRVVINTNFGTYLLTATTSDSVLIFVFTFFLNDFTWMMPTPQDMYHFISPLINSCYVWNAYIHISNLNKLSDPIIIWSSFVAFKQFRTILSFPQYVLVGHWTILHSKDTTVSKSGHDCFMIHKILEVIEW